ncbi:hypothetical protein A2U01_0104432, partial [Trifolium medium]|nr:hypothetical protein [Trifolium medium]
MSDGTARGVSDGATIVVYVRWDCTECVRWDHHSRVYQMGLHG